MIDRDKLLSRSKISLEPEPKITGDSKDGDVIQSFDWKSAVELDSGV